MSWPHSIGKLIRGSLRRRWGWQSPRPCRRGAFSEPPPFQNDKAEFDVKPFLGSYMGNHGKTWNVCLGGIRGLFSTSIWDDKFHKLRMYMLYLWFTSTSMSPLSENRKLLVFMISRAREMFLGSQIMRGVREMWMIVLLSSTVSQNSLERYLS